MALYNCRVCNTELQSGKCLNRVCALFEHFQEEKPETFSPPVSKSETKQNQFETTVISENYKSSTLLGIINSIVFTISVLGCLISILFSFNQCADITGFCPEYSQFTNWTQFAISVAYFLVSLLIFAFVASFDNYVNRKK